MAGYPARARTGYLGIQPAKTKPSPKRPAPLYCRAPFVVYNYSALIFKVKRLFLFPFSDFLYKSNMGASLGVILTYVFMYVFIYAGKEVP